jgi:hypothetical protein
MQQGVPLVDADWNEMNDITRHEIYRGLDLAFPNGLPPEQRAGFPPYPYRSLGIAETPIRDNDFKLFVLPPFIPGLVLIGGRPLKIQTPIRYSDQLWYENPERAEQDGIAMIPQLQTPEADRTDIVYLDVWEREISSTEDPDLINEAIGIETCVREKREFAIRVEEGANRLPTIPPKHFYMPLALLNRKENQALIAQNQIEDIRPFLYGTKGSVWLHLCQIS